VGNELCKGSSVIKRLSGERKVSRRIIEFVRGREHGLFEGVDNRIFILLYFFL
jgi:hypothetical protein